MQPKTIDLNADLGEGAGLDEALIRQVSSINLCCGLHAGGLDTTEIILKLAASQKQHRPLAVGAHPGLPDRLSMGRASTNIPPSMVGEITRYQVDILTRMAKDAGLALSHLKPHGALYHLACSNPGVADQMVRIALHFNLAVMALPQTQLASACNGKVLFIDEGFAERGYLPNGCLIPRGQPGDIIHNPNDAALQAVNLAQAGLHSLCIHGDSPNAVTVAIAVRLALENAGFTISPHR
jgi:UPF0271 protein